MENGFSCSKSNLGSKSVLFALIIVGITVIFIDNQYLSNSILKNNEIHEIHKTIQYKRNKKELHSCLLQNCFKYV